LINRVINSRYEILEQLGNGAFFQVYKARDKSTNQMVAVKSLRPEYISDADFYAGLLRASASVSRLSHSNIARQIEIITEPSSVYVITEYIRGINLKERIRRIAPFTLAVTVDFAVAIAEALHQAHQSGVIHGDLRPQNVIISPEGVLKVTDFGMVQALMASPKAASHNLSQFAYYQAPETISGAPVTPAADIYGLGVILFEMLTGSLPYTGETPLIIATKHQKDPIPSPKAMNASVPRSMDGIVMKALQKHPEDRYRSMNDMLNDLKMVRDALRFGKSLSWSPVSGLQPITVAEPEKERAQEPTSASVASGAKIPSPAKSAKSSVDSATVEELPKAQGKVIKNGDSVMAYGTYDDRVSPYLKIAIGTVLFILLSTLIIGIPLYLATFSKPMQKKLPNLVGMVYDQAKSEADDLGVKLIRHDDFNDQYDPNVIFKTDYDPNSPVYPGKTVNVWVSEGSRNVIIPSVINMTGDDANQQLQQSGLSIGNVTQADSDQIIAGNVISQTPPPGKKVPRSTPVNLVISDGPSANASTSGDNSGSSGDNYDSSNNGSNSSESSASSDNANANNGNSDNSNAFEQNSNSSASSDSGSNSNTSSSSTPSDFTPKRYRIRIKVRDSGPVRVEYTDVNGTHTPINGYYNKGDTIVRSVKVTGPSFTIRTYFNNATTPSNEQTINLSDGH